VFDLRLSTSPFTGAIFLSMNNKQQDGVIRMAENSAVQRIKELDDERAKIFDQAKEEALQKATQAVADLNALGLNYKLTMGSGKSEKKPIKKAKPK
jgi:vacuolar-type H+-ATPase subunit H